MINPNGFILEGFLYSSTISGWFLLVVSVAVLFAQIHEKWPLASCFSHHGRHHRKKGTQTKVLSMSSINFIEYKRLFVYAILWIYTSTCWQSTWHAEYLISMGRSVEKANHLHLKNFRSLGVLLSSENHPKPGFLPGVDIVGPSLFWALKMSKGI